MKRYGQRCPVARALDVVGERWTPLIVRELLLGPRRYTDLLEALPGIGTNMLAGRLSDLQSHGVVVRRTLPPPTPVVVYELTEAGEALAPVLDELRAWGMRFGPAAERDDAIRPAWIIQSAASRHPCLRPGRVCELQVGSAVFELSGSEDGVTVKARPATDANAVIAIEPSDLISLAGEGTDPVRARDRIDVAGDRRLAGEVIEMLAGSAR